MKKFSRILAQTEKGRQGRIPINLSTLVIFKEQNWKEVGGKRFLTFFLHTSYCVTTEKRAQQGFVGALYIDVHDNNLWFRAVAFTTVLALNPLLKYKLAHQPNVFHK